MRKVRKSKNIYLIKLLKRKKYRELMFKNLLEEKNLLDEEFE